MMAHHFTTSRSDHFSNAESTESAIRKASRAAFNQSQERASFLEATGCHGRLEDLATELNLLFAYRIEAETCFARMCADGLPVLRLGQSIGLDLSLEIVADTGHFVLFEESGLFPSVLVTASEARLVDQIVSIAGSVYDALTPRTVDDAVDVLVGQSIADIECRLILRTMRYFKGNGSHAAFALGVEEAELTRLLNKHLVASVETTTRRGGRQ